VVTADGHESKQEAIYWDERARQTGEQSLILRPEDLTPREPIFAAALEALGDVRGKRVLECACGTGLWSVVLAARGAKVTAFDISPESVRVARERVRVNGLAEQVEVIESAFEELLLEPGGFDAVFGVFALHHFDLSAIGPQIHRLLKDGGRAVFVETSSRNPLLMLARKRIAHGMGIGKVGTKDEHPLSKADVELIGQPFRSAECHFPELVFFQLLSRPYLGLFFRPAILRIAPAAFLVRAGWAIFRLIINGLDRLLGRLPPLRKLSYWMVVVLQKNGE